MSTNLHRPAAAWSRDSLIAWDYMKTDCRRKVEGVSDPEGCHYRFLCRWAIKILTLVHEEMDFCGWYWFLVHYFNKELQSLNEFHKPLEEFRDPNTRETDPKT